MQRQVTKLDYTGKDIFVGIDTHKKRIVSTWLKKWKEESGERIVRTWYKSGKWRVEISCFK